MVGWDGRAAGGLEALGPVVKEPRARERLEVEVRDQEGALERARDDEAGARARVELNPVDAEQVAGEVERLAGWREELAAVQRRSRPRRALQAMAPLDAQLGVKGATACRERLCGAATTTGRGCSRDDRTERSHCTGPRENTRPHRLL